MDQLNTDAPLSFEVERRAPDTVTVTIRGELDIAGVEELRRAVAPALAGRPQRLVLELGELSFADTSAIALWVGWSGMSERFELRHVGPLLRRVIDAMGLAERLGVGA